MPTLEASQLSTSSPQFWAVIIAAVITAVAAIIAAIMSTVSAYRQRKYSEQQREIDFRRQQMNELYGPIYMLRRASESLYRLLSPTEDYGLPWRLVDHIAQLKGGDDEVAKNAVLQILKINEQIENILTAKSGLHDVFPPPESLSTFIAHSSLLRLAWDQGKDQEGDQRMSFPRSMDTDILFAINSIRSRLAQLGVPQSS